MDYVLTWLNRYSAAIQALATIFIGGLTWWLVRINARYAKTTADSLKVSQEQLDRQQRIYAEFGLTSEGGYAKVWVANLGSSSFLVSAIKTRRLDRPEPKVMKVNSVVAAGEGERLDVPSGLYEGLTKSVGSLDVALVCVSSGEKRETRWRAFTLYAPQPGIVSTVKAGIEEPWPLACPACSTFDGTFMRTDGLDNFDVAFERQNLAGEELRKSCPNHNSNWIHGATKAY